MHVCARVYLCIEVQVQWSQHCTRVPAATTGAPVDEDSIVDEVHALFSKVVVERIMRRERARHEMRAHSHR